MGVRVRLEWTPLTVGVWKFNVDGFAQRKLGLADCSGVLRDSESRILSLFSSPLGVFDSNVAELRAILFALEMRVPFPQVEVVSLVIESDSTIFIY
ncbi:hypothetical protein GQ457_01G024130 [Hibiscus cannabinus]